MNKKTALLIGTGLCALPLVYLWYIYPQIPSTVALHYNWKGEVDRMGDKTELETVTLVLSGVNLMVLLLMTNLKNFNPQKSKVFVPESFNKFGLLVCMFLCLLQLFILHNTLHPEMNSVKFILAICSLFFMFLGNYMHSLKHNYFAGIKTPWTLADEDNWNATHRLGGKIWFWGGMLSSIACLLVPVEAATITFLAIVLIMTFIPIGYSFLYFKRKNKENE